MNEQINSLTLRAERTRHHLSELIDALQEQITPGELVQQLAGSRAARETADVGAALADQVKRNPLACLLIAAGVGWLIYSDRAQRAPPARRKRAAARRTPAKKRRARNSRSLSPRAAIGFTHFAA